MAVMNVEDDDVKLKIKVIVPVNTMKTNYLILPKVYSHVRILPPK